MWLKNLMIINGLFFLNTWSLQSRGIDLSQWLAFTPISISKFYASSTNNSYVYMVILHIYFSICLLYGCLEKL